MASLTQHQPEYFLEDWQEGGSDVDLFESQSSVGGENEVAVGDASKSSGYRRSLSPEVPVQNSQERLAGEYPRWYRPEHWVTASSRGKAIRSPSHHLRRSGGRRKLADISDSEVDQGFGTRSCKGGKCVRSESNSDDLQEVKHLLRVLCEKVENNERCLKELKQRYDILGCSCAI